jgi:hypothetical protein
MKPLSHIATQDPVQHKDTLLAVQCSDNCIRLYAVSQIFKTVEKAVADNSPPVLLTQRAISTSSTASTKSVYSQADVMESKEGDRVLVTSLASSFLRPIRILEGHTTGEWSIKLNIICGEKYCLHFPSVWNQDISGGKKSGIGKHGVNRNLANTLGKKLSNDGKNHPTHSKAAYRNIIPVDSGGNGNSSGGSVNGSEHLPVGTGGGSSTSGGSVAGVDMSALGDRSYLDVSRSRDASPRGRRSRSQSRGSSVSDDKEFEYNDGASGSGIGDDEGDDEDDEDSLDGDDDDDNDLSMIAGLVSSQLMATEDAMTLDEDDEVLSGLNAASMRIGGPTGLSGESQRFKSVYDQQRIGAHGRPVVQHATEWENSLMIASGCSNGKVMLANIVYCLGRFLIFLSTTFVRFLYLTSVRSHPPSRCPAAPLSSPKRISSQRPAVVVHIPVHIHPQWFGKFYTLSHRARTMELLLTRTTRQL